MIKNFDLNKKNSISIFCVSIIYTTQVNSIFTHADWLATVGDWPKFLFKFLFMPVFIHLFCSLDSHFAKCLFKPLLILIILYANFHHLENLNSLLH